MLIASLAMLASGVSERCIKNDTCDEAENDEYSRSSLAALWIGNALPSPRVHCIGEFDWNFF